MREGGGFECSSSSYCGAERAPPPSAERRGGSPSATALRRTVVPAILLPNIRKIYGKHDLCR